MSRKRKEKKLEKPSSRIRHTHQMIIPFWDSGESKRFIPLCICPFHHGVISRLQTEAYSCSSDCRHYQKHFLENSHYFEVDFLVENSKDRLQGTSKVQKLTPFEEKNSPPFFWVLDRGNRVYFLKYAKAGLVPDLERDHFKLYIKNSGRDYATAKPC